MNKPCSGPHHFSYLHTNLCGAIDGSSWCIRCGVEMSEDEKRAELAAREAKRLERLAQTTPERATCGTCQQPIRPDPLTGTTCGCAAPTTSEEQPPCPVCGCEVRGQGGYLQCECPAPKTTGEL